jgi:hypothetical protein
MGKMDDLGDSENHGHPDGQGAVDESQDDTVDNLLKEHFFYKKRGKLEFPEMISEKTDFFRGARRAKSR